MMADLLPRRRQSGLNVYGRQETGYLSLRQDCLSSPGCIGNFTDVNVSHWYCTYKVSAY